MNRRQLLATLAGLAPAATVRLEPSPTARDLVVIEFPDRISQEHRRRIHETLLSDFPVDQRPQVLVVDGGAKLRVERGVVRVALPQVQTSAQET